MNIFKKLLRKQKPQQAMESPNQQSNDQPYGIDREHAHQRALELLKEDFFWDCTDELAPFGSDEGDMALSEFRDWKKRNPNTPTYECLKWTIESIGEMEIDEYNSKIINPELIKAQIEDVNFNDQQDIYTLDISVIATGFAQLVDEGKIDAKNKPLIQLAIDRQKIWNEQLENWGHKTEYQERLNVLERVLKDA